MQLSEGARRGRIAAVAEHARVMERLEDTGALPPTFSMGVYSDAPPESVSQSLMSRKTRQALESGALDPDQVNTESRAARTGHGASKTDETIFSWPHNASWAPWSSAPSLQLIGALY